MTCSNRLRPAPPRSRCAATGCPTRPCARACTRRGSAGCGWSGAAGRASTRRPGRAWGGGGQGGRQRGLRLVWRGGLGQYPQAGLADCFECSLLTLRPQDAVAAWQTARAADPARPALARAIFEHIPHRGRMAHCLDDDRAQALAGWPAQDILRRLQHRRAQQPAQAVILKLLQAIDAEQSLETFEDILGEDPLLAYRFLVSANSAALDLRTGISSLRRGLVMMGCLALRRWLAELRPDA